MSCSSFGVNLILVGLHQIGVVGLVDAFKSAEAAGGRARDELLPRIVERLRDQNYIPEKQRDAYERAVWREYLRFRGEDFSGFLSEVEVVVRGEPGPARDRFASTLRAVFRSFELAPLVTYEPPQGDGPYPQLVIDGEPIVRGEASAAAFKTAVRRSISDW